MTTYIAEFKAPKQRMTRPFGYVIREQNEFDDGNNKEYIVCRKYYDEIGGYEGGHYNLSYQEAAKLFAEKVTNHVTQYPPEVFDHEAA